MLSGLDQTAFNIFPVLRKRAPAPVYEIRNSAIHGQGVFALSDLNPGDVIIDERIALGVPHISKKQDELNFRLAYRVFQQATLSCQALVLQLTDTTHSARLRQIRQEFLLYQESERSRAMAVVSKFINNAFADLAGSYVMLETSRINHSCLPNANGGRYGSRYAVRAIKPICKGEEILISYINVLCTYAERQRRLESWDITCSCTLCSGYHPRNGQRMRLSNVMNELQKKETMDLFEEAMACTKDTAELMSVRANLAVRFGAYLQRESSTHLSRALGLYKEASSLWTICRGADYRGTQHSMELAKKCQKEIDRQSGGGTEKWYHFGFIKNIAS